MKGFSVHPLVKQEESIYQTSTETNGEGKESDEDKKRLRLRILQIFGLAVWNFQRHPFGSRGKPSASGTNIHVKVWQGQHSETNFRFWAYFSTGGKNGRCPTAPLGDPSVVDIYCVLFFVQFHSQVVHYHRCPQFFNTSDMCASWSWEWFEILFDLCTAPDRRPQPSSAPKQHECAGHWFTFIFIHHSREELFVRIVSALCLENFFVLDSTRPTSSEAVPPCRRRLSLTAWRYIPKQGSTLSTLAICYVWFEKKTKLPFDSQATSNMFRPLLALWSQTHQQRFTSRSLALFFGYMRWKIHRQCHRCEDYAMILVTRTRGGQEKLPVDPIVKVIECIIENFVSMVAVTNKQMCTIRWILVFQRKLKARSGSGGRHVGCFRTFHGRNRRRRCSFFDSKSSGCPYFGKRNKE